MKVRFAITLLALASCDPRAKASDGAAKTAKSKEYETCASTADCADDLLRCFDHVCRRTARSTVGDYFAALGAAARKKGDTEAAIDAYTRALGHYGSEKIALPPDVDCAYGAALADAATNKEHAELGARVLHRCILALSSANPLRDQALADLTRLDDAGLDPLTLGRSGLADTYLTRAPSVPSADKLTVAVAANPDMSGKASFHVIPDKLAEAGTHAALVACWQQFNAVSHKDTLTATIGVKVSYTPSEYEDEAGVYSTKVDPAAQPADQCVHDAVEAALKDLKTIKDAFQTQLVVTIK